MSRAEGSSPEELLDLAVTAARRAGDLLLEHFRAPAAGVEAKTTPTDLVSDADRDAEAVVVDAIAAARPDDGILAEEGARRESRSGLRWIIDPLDGTVNFLFRIPVWGVSVAVVDAAGPLAAVVVDPNRGEAFTARRGGGAWLDDAPMRVSTCESLERALVGTGFAYAADARAVQAERLPRLLPRVRDIRRAGSAAIDLAWTACGRLDVFFEAPMNPWDKAAGVLLVTEAGGVVSELPAPLDDAHGVIAGPPALHDELRRFLMG